MAEAPLWGKWEWYWKENEAGEADCGILTESGGGAYAIVRCPRYFTQEQWTRIATHICDLHNTALK